MPLNTPFAIHTSIGFQSVDQKGVFLFYTSLMIFIISFKELVGEFLERRFRIVSLQYFLIHTKPSSMNPNSYVMAYDLL